MAYTKEFNLSPWKNKHISKTTPLGATRLNIMNNAISRNEDRTIELSEAAETAAGEMELTQEALAMLQSDYMRFKTEAGKVANMQIQNRKLYYNNKVVKPSDMVTYLSNGYKIVAEKDNILYTLSQYSIDDKRYAFSALVNSENRKPQTNVITLWNGAGGTDVFNYYSEYSVEVASTEELEQTNEALWDIANHDKAQDFDIKNLYAMAEGKLYREELDSRALTEKVVSTGAMPKALVNALGGMSRKCRNLLNLSKITANNSWKIDNNTFTNAITDNASVFVLTARLYNRAQPVSGQNYIEIVTDATSESGWLKASFTKSEGYDWLSIKHNGHTQDIYVYFDISHFENGKIYTFGVGKKMTDVTVVGGASFYKPIIVEGTVSLTESDYEPYTPNLIDSPVDSIKWLGKYENLLNDYQKNWIKDNLNLWNLSAKKMLYYPLTSTVIVCNLEHDTTSDGKVDYLITTDEAIPNATFGSNRDYYVLHSDVIDSSNTINIPPKNGYPVIIPQTIIDRCPDYGIGINAECFNYIDWVEKKYHHMASRDAMDSLEYSVPSTTWTHQYLIKYNASKTLNVLSAYYNLVDVDTFNAHLFAGVHGDILTDVNGQVYLSDDANSIEELKAKLNEVYLYREMINEEIIDLSDVITDDMRVLEVEAGGTIQMHYPALDDGYVVDVPNTEAYMIKLGGE